MDQTDPFRAVANMVMDAEKHADDQANERLRAVEYYRGVMKDTKSDKGRSAMTTRDVRAHIKKVLPSMVRTILGNDEVVEYQPIGPEDEDSSAQASDYVNFVVLQESGAEQAIHDAIHDALLLRNGIIKWWWDSAVQVRYSTHTGLDEESALLLASDDSVEVLEYGETPDGITMKVRRTVSKGCLKVSAVPRERFLIHPDAVSLDDSLLTGEKTELRRSDLVAMGYDKAMIDSLPLAEEDDDERDARRDIVADADEAVRANQPIDYYDLYVRIDLDGDGISELRHMCFAGGLKERNLLINDECDEVQFADIAVMRQPHQWEGISLFDDTEDLQRAKTVLFRGTLDNIYWQNNPQPLMQSGAIENPDAVYNPEFGMPIEVRQGVDVRSAMSFNQVPFVANHSFAMMDYIDGEAQDRTGVSDASAGLAPDALQNMTAKASAMIEQAGIGQTELMVRTAADGLKRLFRGILRTIIKHQDRERTVRLRGEWVAFDPRHWNAEMDVTVNTGLGAGTRERDVMMMQQVIGLQEKLLAAFGPDNPYVKPNNVFNAINKFTEAAGLRSARLYFTEPDPQEVEAKLEAMRNAPNPEQMRIEAEAQKQAAKVQATKEIEHAKMVAQRDKERAQMEADLQVERARLDSKLKEQANAIAADLEKQARQIAWEREQFAANMALEGRKIDAQQRADAADLARQFSGVRNAMDVSQ